MVDVNFFITSTDLSGNQWKGCLKIKSPELNGIYMCNSQSLHGVILLILIENLDAKYF